MQTLGHLSVLVALVISALLLTACVGDGDIPVTSDNPTEPTLSNPVIGSAMTIEGKIIEVMESWPLQLTVETQTSPLNVGLLAETEIIRQGQVLGPGELTPGVRVRIEGENTGPNAMSARTIEILEE